MNEVTKVNVRYRYPWKDLIIGDSFIIPKENISGIKYHRQLVYATNKSFKQRNLPNRYKSFIKPDGTVEVIRLEDITSNNTIDISQITSLT